MKTYKSESVLHDWVHELPFQQQALLMTGMRGPDGLDKHNAAKIIVRYLRGCVLKPAGDWNGLNNNDFMWADYSVGLFDRYTHDFWSDHDHYPHHFIMHLLHCCEVVGYKHPITHIRNSFLNFYCKGCRSFHMTPETAEQMDNRLDDFGFAAMELKPVEK